MYKHGRIKLIVGLLLHVFYDNLQSLPISAVLKKKKLKHSLQYWVHGLMVRHVDIAHKWLHSQWNDINLHVLKFSCTREKEIIIHNWFENSS